MELQESSSSRWPLRGLLFVLLCGVIRFAKANPTTPCEWAAAHLGYDPAAFTCTGLGLEIRPSDSSTHALHLSFRGTRGSVFLPRLPPMVKVNLSRVCMAEVQENAFTQLSDLDELDLSGNCLQVIRDGTLRGLGRLKTLDLRHNLISEVGPDSFAGLDAVRTVWLQNNKLDSIPGAISGLADLDVLSLANNRISRVDSGRLHGCPNLTALYLQHNRISALSADAFRGLWRLQMLDLGANLLEMMPGSTLESLWGRGADVRLHGNPWRCDCGLAELRDRSPRWLTGRVVCHGGPLHGAPLSSLSSGQLGCGRRTLRVSQTVTAHVTPGRGLRIPCGNGSGGGEAQYWQTPFGRLEFGGGGARSGREPVEMLRDGSIKMAGATPYHTGLYYCLRAWPGERVVLPYRVEYAHGGARPRRSRGAEGQREGVSAHRFVAAVTSGAAVAFLTGFAAGAFSRTYLSRGFRRLGRRRGGGGVGAGTSPWQYENETFRKDGEGGGPGVTPSATSTLEASGSLGAAYLEGCDSGRESPGEEEEEEEEEVEVRTGEDGGGAAWKRRARERGGAHDGGGAAGTDPGGSERPSKRRVIRVYNYDEEGTRYGHVRDEGGAPGATLRTRSLTRLNAIMAAASGPVFGGESPQEDAEEEEATPPDDQHQPI